MSYLSNYEPEIFDPDDNEEIESYMRELGEKLEHDPEYKTWSDKLHAEARDTQDKDGF